MKLSNIVNIPYDGKDQWWVLSITAEFPTPDKSHYYRCVELMRWVELMKDINPSIRIIARPLIGKDLPLDDWTSYRGYENDPNPFVVRKKMLPCIRANIDTCNRFSSMSFFPDYSRDYITPGQHYWLNEKFGLKLQSFRSMEMLQHLADIAIENSLLYNLKKMEELQMDLEIGMNRITDYRKHKIKH